MALDESGGYDLARGFDTLIEGGRPQTQAIRDLQTSLMTALTMQRDTTPMASGRPASAMNPNLVRSVNNLQPDPQAGAVVAASPGEGGSGVTTQSVLPVAARPEPAGDPQAGATVPQAAVPQPSSEGAASQQGGSGMLDSLLNVLPFGNHISDALNFGREQRNKNAEFQAIQGGSNP